jgi:hypothetical protein
MIDLHGPPVAIRSDNGPELTSQSFTDWCGAVEVSATSGAHLLRSADIHVHTGNASVPATQREENPDSLPSSVSRLVELKNALSY